MSSDSRFARLWSRVLPALGLAACAGALAQVLHVPLPWMIGPLITATHVLRVVLITVCAPKVCGFFLRFAAPPR